MIRANNRPVDRLTFSRLHVDSRVDVAVPRSSAFKSRRRVTNRRNGTREDRSRARNPNLREGSVWLAGARCPPRATLPPNRTLQLDTLDFVEIGAAAARDGKLSEHECDRVRDSRLSQATQTPLAKLRTRACVRYMLTYELRRRAAGRRRRSLDGSRDGEPLLRATDPETVG